MINKSNYSSNDSISNSSYAGNTTYESFFFQKYERISKEKYKHFFFNKIDEIIISNLSIDYEFKIDNDTYKRTTSFIDKIEDDNYFEYIENIIFPNINKLAVDNKTFLEIEAMQLVYKRREYGNNFNINNKDVDEENNNNQIKDENENEEKEEIYLLSEKEFEIIRNVLFKFFILEFIDNFKNSRMDKPINQGNNIIHSNSNLESVTLSTEDFKFSTTSWFKNKSSSKYFEIGQFLKYNYVDKEPIYSIKIKFAEFLENIQNEIDIEAISFWFIFFIPIISINISYYEYELFPVENMDENFIDQDFKLFVIFSDYIYLNKTILNSKLFNAENIILNIHDNILINRKLIESEMFINLWNLRGNNLKNYVINENYYFSSLKYNTLILNTYGKYSQFSDFFDFALVDQMKLNNVNSIFINFYRFNDYEYFTVIKESENYIENIQDNFTELIELINKLIRISEPRGLNLLKITVDGFNSTKTYFNPIMVIFENFLNDIFRLFSKNNLFINFNDLDTVKRNSVLGYNSAILCDPVWKFHPKNIIKKVNKLKNETNLKNEIVSKMSLITSNQNLSLDNINLNLSKSLQLCNNDNFFTHLNILESNLKIINNKQIDIYLFKNPNLSLPSITHLKLGSFQHFEDLNLFLSKLNFKLFHNLQKINLYCISNKGLNKANLNKFLNLNWPKKIFKSLKIFFEKFDFKMDFSIFEIYHEIMKNKFLKDSCLDFFGIIKINNNLIYKINSNNLAYIANNLPLIIKKKRNPEEKKSLGNFFLSTCIIEYYNWKTILPFISAASKNKFFSRLFFIKNQSRSMPLLQYIIQFLKSTRIIYQDYANSYEVFEIYENIIFK